MKRNVTAVILCLALLLSVLPGCGKKPAKADPAPSAEADRPAEPDRPVGLVEVEGLTLAQGEWIQSAAISGGEALLVSGGWSDEGPDPDHHFFYIDTASAKVSSSAVFVEPDYVGYTDAELTGDEVLLPNARTGTAQVFRRDGTFLEKRSCDLVWGDQLPQREPGEDGCALIRGFTPYSDFAVRSDPSDAFAVEQAFAFRDDPEAVWRVKDCPGIYMARQGRRILLQRQGDEGSLVFVLLDLDAGTENTVTYRCPAEGREMNLNATAAAVGGDTVLICVSASAEDFSGQPVLLWYPDPAEAKPADVRRLTREDLQTELAEQTAALGGTYGLTFRLNEGPAPKDVPVTGTGLAYGQNECLLGADLYAQYIIVRDLGVFLSMLPEGFTRELYTDLGWDLPDRETLEVFIVREIPGTAGAFAMSWREPMGVCFATDEYFLTQIPHEFMHLIDLRLNEYGFANGADWEPAWWALSPEGAYGDAAEMDENYFVSFYAKTNAGEDRAELFMKIWFSGGPLSEQYWYKDAPGVQKKAAVLIRAIRAAFPSVQAVEQAYWERNWDGAPD